MIPWDRLLIVAIMAGVSGSASAELRAVSQQETGPGIQHLLIVPELSGPHGAKEARVPPYNPGDYCDYDPTMDAEGTGV